VLVARGRPRTPHGAALQPSRARRLLPAGVLVALYGAAAVVATAPAVASFRSAFIAGGAPGFGEAAAGDHLQSVYRFWLVGRQLENGAAPWRDPFSFQPLAGPQLDLAGWPFGLPFWPLDTLFGPVVAWNVLLLAVIVGAGLATHGWLRTLGVSPAAAALGGLAFAIAPYRLAQSSGHLLGWLAIFIPLALWAFERSRAATAPWRANAWGALAALALVTIPLSGQVHLALGAIPFCLTYAAIRFRWTASLWVAAGAAAGAAVGVLIRETVIADSAQSQGRTLDQVEMFQSGWLDLVSRFRGDGLEQYAYTGWLTPLLAVAGLALIVRRRPWLAALLGVAVVVPLLLAVGTNLPTYAPLYHHFPPFRYPRVPGRLIPIADLALAALAALALARALVLVPIGRRGLALGLATLLVAGDLLVLPFRPTAADPANAAYRQLAQAAPGRVVELPLFEPGIHFGSVYHYYAMQAPRQRPGGYSTLAPFLPYSFFWAMNRLNCGAALPEDEERLRGLGVRYVLFHAGVYEQSRKPGAWFAWRALERAGYRATARGGRVWLFPLRPDPATPVQPPPVPEPDRATPVFCEGWRGWRMKERDAPLWIWGDRDVELELAAPERSKGLVRVDGTRLQRFEVRGSVTLVVPLEGRRWHSIVLEIPELFQGTKPPQGFELVRLTYREGGEETEFTPGG